MKDHREVVGWGFWLRWLIASVIGLGMGVLLWLGVGTGMEVVGIGSQGMVSRVLLPGLVGATFGTPFGIAQWIVLRRYLRRMEFLATLDDSLHHWQRHRSAPVARYRRGN